MIYSTRKMNVLRAIKLFLILTILCGQLCLSKRSVPPLTMTRIYSELKDIDAQGISLDVPFNTTVDEVGMRTYDKVL